MKKIRWNRKWMNKVYFGILFLVILVVTSWASYGMLNAGKGEKTYAISVIVNNSNSDRWTAMHEGLVQAAVDNHITLNFVSTGEIQDREEEETLIKRELENGADGLIIQMVSSYGVSDIIEKISSKAAIVLIESDITPEEVYTTVMPDNEAIGRAVGRSIIDDMGENVKGKKIGILCSNQSELSMVKRLKGLKSSLDKCGAKIVWTLAATPDNFKVKLMEKQENDPVDILVALNNDETEAAADLLQTYEAGKKKWLLYGEGCSEKNVYFLDKGIIKSLVVPNEFNMGYLSVDTIANQLKFKLASAENTQIDFLVINKNNLNNADNQKVLFPIVQ